VFFSAVLVAANAALLDLAGVAGASDGPRAKRPSATAQAPKPDARKRGNGTEDARPNAPVSILPAGGSYGRTPGPETFACWSKRVCVPFST